MAENLKNNQYSTNNWKADHEQWFIEALFYFSKERSLGYYILKILFMRHFFLNLEWSQSEWLEWDKTQPSWLLRLFQMIFVCRTAWWREQRQWTRFGVSKWQFAKPIRLNLTFFFASKSLQSKYEQLQTRCVSWWSRRFWHGRKPEEQPAFRQGLESRSWSRTLQVSSLD